MLPLIWVLLLQRTGAKNTLIVTPMEKFLFISFLHYLKFLRIPYLAGGFGMCLYIRHKPRLADYTAG